MTLSFWFRVGLVLFLPGVVILFACLFIHAHRNSEHNRRFNALQSEFDEMYEKKDLEGMRRNVEQQQEELRKWDETRKYLK